MLYLVKSEVTYQAILLIIGENKFFNTFSDILKLRIYYTFSAMLCNVPFFVCKRHQCYCSCIIASNKSHHQGLLTLTYIQ